MIPGPGEWLVIFGVALLLFGPSKLPQLGSAIGESIRNFRKGMKPLEEDENPKTQSSQILLPPQQNKSPAQIQAQVVEQKSE